MFITIKLKNTDVNLNLIKNLKHIKITIFNDIILLKFNIGNLEIAKQLKENSKFSKEFSNILYHLPSNAFFYSKNWIFSNLLFFNLANKSSKQYLANKSSKG